MSSHSHGQCSHHAPKHFGNAFAVSILLNLGYVVFQAIYGVKAHSLALLADAGHNLGDVLSLLLAWGAYYLSKRPATERRTYGWRRTSILVALTNAILLLVAVGAISWEAIRRFHNLKPVEGGTVMWVAGLGIVINMATALFFFSGRKTDLNIKGAYLHMAADAAVSAGVVIAGAAIAYTGWLWLDPTVSLIINLIIVLSTWGLLKDSVNLALDAVPEGISPAQVRAYLESLSGITGVHDLHIWAMSTTETALTAHLIRPQMRDDDALLREATSELQKRFQIGHVTLQFEVTLLEDCKLI